jgi:hypothetical protein
MMDGTPAPPANKIPICRAGDDMEITLPTNTIKAIGTASDIDGFIAASKWEQLKGLTATINSPESLITTITDLKEGLSVFQLTVTDDKGGFSYDDLIITVNPAPPVNISPITGFKLINAATEQEAIAMAENGAYSIAQYGPKLNIKADTTNEVTKVQFELTGAMLKSSPDRKTPFALHGDDGKGNYYYGNWNPPKIGVYKLVATPFNIAGDALPAATINFEFIA